MVDSITVFNVFIVLLPMYLLDTKKLNRLIIPTMLAPIPLLVNEILGLSFFDFLESRHLILAYGLLGVAFIWLMMNRYRWNYTQALPIASLIILAGSFYWEIPYLIRNAILVGFEWDWLLHISGIVPFIALYYLVGTQPRMYTSFKIMYFVVGLLLSLMLITIMPIAPKTGTTVEWDSFPYLMNRIVCTLILFNIFNTSEAPKKGLIYHDREVK